MDTTVRITSTELRNAARVRRVADARYWATIAAAKEQGMTNSKIARAVGVTEAAIRLYWVRHPQVDTHSDIADISLEVVS